MFTHPDLLGSLIDQRRNELLAAAEHERLLTVALRRRRAARAAARAARHLAESSVSARGPRTIEPHPAA